MNRIIQTPDEILAAIHKPSLELVDRVSLSADDWLIVCAGFEDRSVAVLQKAASEGKHFNVVLINYAPFIAENRSESIRALCRGTEIKISEVTYDRQEPGGFGDILIQKIRTSAAHIFIDISGMSRLLIVQVLVALSRHPKQFDNCFVAYTEAASYPPNEDEAALKLAKSELDPSFSIFFLSSGVYEVTLIPELSSYASAGVQTRLIAFPSLDAHQLTALRAELQPSRLSLIEGIPPDSRNQWRKRIIAEVNQLGEIQNTEKYSVSTLNYQDTLMALLKIYEEHAFSERLLVSPTGSKMQAVAVGIVRSFLEDIQIVYPTPRDFLRPERYTEGIGQMYVLPLEPFSAREHD